MPTIYGLVKRIHRSIVPLSFRGALHDHHSFAGKLFLPCLRIFERFANHDEIYDVSYYERNVDPGAKTSARVIADSIISAFTPISVIDVGCGSGALLSELKERGIQTFGVDYSQAAIDLCRSRGLNVEPFDLETKSDLARMADVVISTEVAEHLPESRADAYVHVLCACAPIVVMTAATPGQGGTDHVNERPHAYWIEKLSCRGYQYEQQLSEDWRKSWAQKGVMECYARNVMLFRKVIS